MAKKFQFRSTGSMLGNIGGAAVAGVGSAALDKYLGKYITSADGKSYGKYLKAGLGIALPFISGNRLITTAGNGLLAIGLGEIMSGILPSVGGVGSSHVGSAHVGEMRRRWSIPLSTTAQKNLSGQRPVGSQQSQNYVN